MLVRHILSLVFATAGLAACRDGDDRTNGATTAPTAQATADKDTQSGKEGLYTMEISLPDLPPGTAALRSAIEAFVAARKHDFLGGLDSAEARRYAHDMPWDLHLDIAVASRTDRFLNVQVDGSAFTGGAHPSPILDSFTYDLKTQRLVRLDDLFDDPQAAESAFAAEARRQLIGALDDEDDPLASSTEQVDDGTSPGKDHFRIFSLLTGPDDKVHGLTFIFPPYQVAAYSAGPQAVDVPSETFLTLLKPAYREAFR